MNTNSNSKQTTNGQHSWLLFLVSACLALLTAWASQSRDEEIIDEIHRTCGGQDSTASSSATNVGEACLFVQNEQLVCEEGN